MQRLRVIDYPWHQVHGYRLMSLPVDFDYLMVRTVAWDSTLRPIPAGLKRLVVPGQVQPGDYDLALLHLDQWCDTSNNLRALPFRVMREVAQGVPQVIIMHGTPDTDDNRERIWRLIGDLPVVCNSVQAAQEWDAGRGALDCYGLPQYRAIIHGYKDEFFNYPLMLRKPEAFTICSGGNMSNKYHGLPLVQRLMRDLPVKWYGARGTHPWLPDYAAYRDMLASSLVYVSPTRRAPMPGARTEAMLSGCCIVSTLGNDVETYIEHGRTGFLCETYTDVRDYTRLALLHPREAYKVGQAGREAALGLFSEARYVADWLQVLGDIGVQGGVCS